MKAKTFFTIFPIFLYGLNIYSQSWSSVGTGTDNWVTALKGDIAHNVLYAGGYFTQAGGNNTAHIAKWNGANWVALGSGVDQGVHALEIISNDLYVGGEFLNAGGISATRIAKYDGTTWTAFGGGIGGSVNAIAEYNGEVYAGYLDINTSPYPGIRKWNGSSWVNVGAGVGGINSDVLALKVYNGELYVAGDFTTAGGLTCNGIAKWNGSVWSTVGTGLNNLGIANTLEIFNGELYVGGDFSSAGGVAANSLAKWNGTNWAPVGNGVSGGIPGFNTSINALKRINNSLYLGGNFNSAGGATANFVAIYNGSSFSSLSSGTNERIYQLDSYNGDLVAGGQFSQAGGITTNNIAEWSIPAGIKDIQSNYESVIYPNPFNNSATIQLNGIMHNADLNIYNWYGQKIKTINNISGDKIKIEKGSLISGAYFYELIQESKNISTGKLLIID